MNEDEMWSRAAARAAAYRAAWELARVDGATLEQAHEVGLKAAETEGLDPMSDLAIRFLNAKPSEHGGYSYYASETQRQYVVTPEAIRALGEMLYNEREDAYSKWCSEYEGKEIG
jgi:hypothetical protein